MIDNAGQIIAIVAGINVITLGTVLLNSYRVGKLEGMFKNGGYLRCPFYKGHVNKEVKAGQHGKNT